MSPRLLFLAGLSACASDALPQPQARQAPPTSELRLAAGAMLPGSVAEWVVDGLQPGERVYVLRGTGLGPGACPPVGAGLCLDITGSPSLLTTGRADAAGTARMTLTVPVGLPVDLEVGFQAVALPGPGRADAAKSNPVARTLTDVPLADLSGADVVVSEVMADPASVADAVGEWFELTNVGATAVDLQGLRVEDAGSGVVVDRPLVVAPGGRAVFARSGDPSVNGGLWVDHAWLAGFSLTNTGDQIRLTTGGVVLDEVVWTESTPGVSWSLSSTRLDATGNDDALAWCDGSTAFGDGDLGTPGGANPVCPLAAAVCGDGVVQGLEACDAGGSNGMALSSCASDCTSAALSFAELPAQPVIAATDPDAYVELRIGSNGADDVPDVWLSWGGVAAAVEGRDGGGVYNAPILPCHWESVPADLDGDGRMSLLWHDGSRGHLQVCGVAEDGSAETQTYVGGWQSLQGVATLDAYGDGVQDIAVADAFSDGVWLASVTTDGVVSDVLLPTVGPHGGAAPSEVVADDLDGDGHDDLVAVHGTGLVVLWGQGAGSFSPPVGLSTLVAGLATAPWKLTLRDLDEDGDAELVTRHGDHLAVFWNSGSRSFGAPEVVSAATAGSSWMEDLFVGDVDEDGLLDFLVVLDEALVWVPGTGSGFGARQYIAARTERSGTAFGDVTGDGIPDLVVKNEDVTVLPGLAGAGAFGVAYVAFDDDAASRELELGDLDDDGDLDGVAVTGGEMEVYLNDGSGRFDAAGANRVVPGFGPGLHLLDIDGDGGLDAFASRPFYGDWAGGLHGVSAIDEGGVVAGFVASETAGVHDVHVPDDATYAYAGRGYEWGGSTGAPPHLPGQSTRGDMDGDGVLDWVLVSPAGLFTDPGGFSWDLTAHHTGSYAGARGLTAVDLNGDGALDVALLDDARNTLDVFLNDGVGGLVGPSSHPTGVSDADQLLIADVTGEGVLDAVMVSESQDVLRVLPGFGGGSFGAGLSVQVSSLPISLDAGDGFAAGDLDGDGHVDLAVALSNGGGVAVIRGFGAGVFGEPTLVPTTSPPRAVQTADLDGDARLDLVVAIQSGAIQTFLGR